MKSILTLVVCFNAAFGAVIPPANYINAEQAEKIAKWKLGDAGQPWAMSGQLEGDMILTKDQKNGVISNNFRWPSRTLVYQFDPRVNQNERAAIKRAIQYFNTNTCIRVIERTNERDYVYITTGNSGCWSQVGRVGGPQGLNLQSNGCIYTHTILHEFLHALGFYHMQSTYNRDDFVNIYWNNIQQGMEHNFDFYSKNDVSDFGERYDYKSVMHYPENAFSINGYATIAAKDGTSLSNYVGLTEIDRRKLLKMYGCSI